MTPRHTPGPWRYDYAPGYCGELLAANGTTIAEFVTEPSEGNARLIAAAPELLEALKQLSMWLPIMTEVAGMDAEGTQVEFSDFLNDPSRQPETISIASSMTAARAAIAKATD